MYLKRDINGQASGIEYGKIGDNVTIIERGRDWKCDMILVENKGTRFFVFEDDLSNDKIEKVNLVTQVTGKDTKNIQRLDKKKGRK